MTTHRCEVCGNDYDKAFEINIGGATHVFDSFECAIDMLAPRCENCGCRIIGHGGCFSSRRIVRRPRRADAVRTAG